MIVRSVLCNGLITNSTNYGIARLVIFKSQKDIYKCLKVWQLFEGIGLLSSSIALYA